MPFLLFGGISLDRGVQGHTEQQRGRGAPDGDAQRRRQEEGKTVVNNTRKKRVELSHPPINSHFRTLNMSVVSLLKERFVERTRIDRFFQPATAIFSKGSPIRHVFFRGYELVVLGSRRSANVSKKMVFEPFAKSEKGVLKVGL